MSRHRMDAGDVAWLHMDRATNRMIVTSVLWTDEPLDWNGVRTAVRDRLVARYPRFSQRVTELASMVWWNDVEGFDIDGNLEQHRLPDPGDRTELADYISALLHHSLPPERPLWQLHFIDNYRGGSAVVCRIHHCVADGIALARVMLSLCDPAGPEPVDAPRRANNALHVGGVVLDDLAHPARLKAVLERAASGTRALSRVVTMAPDVSTCLRGRAQEHKRVLWSDPFSLESIHAAATAADVTVNEFMLGVASGALRAYLSREDGNAPDIRAIVPVNLRPLDKPLPRGLGNRFGLVYLPLPVSIDDPLARLQRIRHDSRAVLQSAEGVVTFDLLDLFGHTVYSIEQIVVDLFASKGTAVITNVAGPDRPLSLAGRRLAGIVAWPPESGNVALGLSVISFDGAVVVGLLADVHLVRDPEFLLEQIEHQLGNALAAAVVT